MAALNRMQFANYQISRTSVDLINQKYHDLKHQIEFLKREISEEDKLAYLSGMERERFSSMKLRIKPGTIFWIQSLRPKVFFARRKYSDHLRCGWKSPELFKFHGYMLII